MGFDMIPMPLSRRERCLWSIRSWQAIFPVNLILKTNPHFKQELNIHPSLKIHLSCYKYNAKISSRNRELFAFRTSSEGDNTAIGLGRS